MIIVNKEKNFFSYLIYRFFSVSFKLRKLSFIVWMPKKNFNIVEAE